MHPDDLTALTAIPKDASPDWSTWLGCVEGAAEYLSPAGLEVFGLLRSEIPAFFGGQRWLDQAVGKRTVADSAMLSPVLAWSDPLEQFATLLRIWTVARLAQARPSTIEGVERVRRAVRANITTSRFLHSLTQLELAGAGWHLGAAVELEPPKDGGPGDVRLRTSDTEVFLEVVTLATDQGFARDELAHDLHHAHLLKLETRYRVRFDGALPGVLDDDDEHAWLVRTTAAAKRCARTGQPIAATGLPVAAGGPDAETLLVRPDGDGVGRKLNGPMIEIDPTRRLLSALERKAHQTSSVTGAWLWLVDHNDAMRLTPFARATPDEKVRNLHALVNGVLERHPHLAGIVWTYTTRIVSPIAPTDVHCDEGFAVVRSLPGLRGRLSVLIPRRLVLPHQTGLLVRMLQRESDWLDHALDHLGYRGGLDTLLAARTPTPAAKTLWTPRA